MQVARDRAGVQVLWQRFFRDVERERALAVANVEMDTAVPCFEYRGKNPPLIIQNSARTPSIAVGYDVSFLKHGQDVRQRRGCASDVHHDGQADSVRRL